MRDKPRKVYIIYTKWYNISIHKLIINIMNKECLSKRGCML